MPDLTWAEFKGQVDAQLAALDLGDDVLVRYVDWSSVAAAVRIEHDPEQGDIYIEEEW